MNPSLRTLSGETQRIATEALAKGTLSHEELVAAILLLKVQRNDARAEAAKFRALLDEALTEALHADGLSVRLLAEFRVALAVKP